MRIACTFVEYLTCAAVLLCASCAGWTQQPQVIPTVPQAASAASQASIAPQAADVTRPGLPPSAILAETLATFEQTRAEIANWSEIEMAAFRVTTAQAKAECHRLEQTPHEAEESLALARLCSVGMEWDGSYSAARWYTRLTAPPGEATHLALGFGLLLQADLNLQAVQRAMDNLKEMNERLALSADTDSIFSYVVNATEVMRPEYGLEAALMRQTALLEVVSGTTSASPPIAPGAAEAEAWHTLMLLHGAQRRSDEANAKARLLEAKAKRSEPMMPVDTYLAARARTQYEWLGRPAPAPQIRNTTASGRKADPHPSVELMVIQRESASDVLSLSQGVNELRRRLPKGAGATLILIADAHLSIKQAPATSQAHASYTEENLFETLGFSNGPLFLIKDKQGRVAYFSTGSSAWLNPQMQAETLVERTLEPAASSPSAP